MTNDKAEQVLRRFVELHKRNRKKNLKSGQMELFGQTDYY